MDRDLEAVAKPSTQWPSIHVMTTLDPALPALRLCWLLWADLLEWMSDSCCMVGFYGVQECTHKRMKVFNSYEPVIKTVE